MCKAFQPATATVLTRFKYACDVEVVKTPCIFALSGTGSPPPRRLGRPCSPPGAVIEPAACLLLGRLRSSVRCPALACCPLASRGGFRPLSSPPACAFFVSQRRAALPVTPPCTPGARAAHVRAHTCARASSARSCAHGHSPPNIHVPLVVGEAMGKAWAPYRGESTHGHADHIRVPLR